MQPKLQRRIQRYGWDKAAADCEPFWGEQLRPAQDSLIEMAGLNAGERVIDIACGTGLVTLRAARAVGPEGYVLATDLSQEMVATTQALAQEHDLAQIKTLRCGAEELECEDQSVDVALCALGLMYVPLPLEALQEMARVLVPGGRAVAAVWGERSACGWAEIFPIVDARVKSEVCPMFFQLGSPGALETVLGMAGLVDIEAQRISTLLHYDNQKQAPGAAFVGGPVAMAYSRFDQATRAEAHVDYLDSIAPHRVGEGYQIPGEFVIVRGLASQVSEG